LIIVPVFSCRELLLSWISH